MESGIAATVVATMVAIAAMTTTREAAADEIPPGRRGSWMPLVDVGLGVSEDLTIVGIGLGLRYYAVTGLGIGGEVSDSILLYSGELKRALPGLEEQLPTNIVRVSPSLQYVFLRTRWFSPYIAAGIGPVIFDNGVVVGEWRAGPGAYVGIAGPVFLDLGIEFSSMFPKDTCDAAFVYSGAAGTGQVLDACGFAWQPHAGLVVAFGGGPRRRERDEPEPDPAADPAPPDPVGPATQPSWP